MAAFRILHQDPHLVAIDKPAGFHVHPPEDTSIRIPASVNCLALLNKQLGQYLYPVHRLDSATSGVLFYALDPQTARDLNAMFTERRIEKLYFCVVRGWLDQPLTIDRALSDQAALTRVTPLARIELPHAVGPHPTTRYALLRAEPETGRYHQIRRHLAGISHPLIGDTMHGDGKHNRFFREQFDSHELLLKCQAMSFQHPRTGALLRVHSRWTGKWHRIFDLFGLCPVA